MESIRTRLRALGILVVFSLAPAFASAQIPDFPMALWGVATINAAPAPEGTLIRAYYGSDLAGEIAVKTAGVYGYTEPTKQKLLIGEGDGALRFTFQEPGKTESEGATPVTHAAFTSGEVVEKNLAFTAQIQPTETEENSSNNSSRGGGTSKPRSTPQVLGAATSSAPVVSTSNPVLIELIRQLQLAIQKLKSMGAAIDPAVEAAVHAFSNSPADPSVRDLVLGMSGSDVRALQILLIKSGHPIPAGATGYFGEQTRNALIAYQNTHGITPAIGYFGATVRAQMKASGLAGIWW